MTLPQIHDTLTQAYDNVKEFWVAFKLPWCKTWIDSSKHGRTLAANLMEEELSETLNAPDKASQLDGFCDLLYVTMGGMHAVGFPLHYLMLTSVSNFTGPLAESIKYLREDGIICRRLHDSLPQACFGLIDAAARKFPRFREAFTAVHKANMSKLWDHIPSDPELTSEPTTNNKFIVRRKSDGKIIKPPTFRHPDLATFV